MRSFSGTQVVTTPPCVPGNPIVLLSNSEGVSGILCPVFPQSPIALSAYRLSPIGLSPIGLSGLSAYRLSDDRVGARLLLRVSGASGRRGLCELSAISYQLSRPKSARSYGWHATGAKSYGVEAGASSSGRAGG